MGRIWRLESYFYKYVLYLRGFRVGLRVRVCVNVCVWGRGGESFGGG